MATRKQIAAARRNLRTARAARRRTFSAFGHHVPIKGHRRRRGGHHHRLSRSEYADALAKAVYTLRHNRRRRRTKHRRRR